MSQPTDTVAFALAWIFIETAIPMIIPNRMWAGIIMGVVGLGFLASALEWLPPLSRALAWKYSLPAFVLAGAGFGVCAWAITTKLAASNRPAESPPPPAAQITVPAPPITVRYQLMGGLPIEVPGHSTLNVLQIYPTKDQMPWFFQVGNNGSERSFWPEQTLKPEEAMGFVTRCEVINLGQSAVINLVLDFALEYSREIPDPNHPKQTTSGPTFARQDRRAMISLLQPNTPFVFFMVNQSPFFVNVTPPKTATIQMLEESTPRRIALVQPQASVEDLFALHLTFFPSRYPWKGLPELAIH